MTDEQEESSGTPMFSFEELKELCAEQAQTIIDLANEVRELQRQQEVDQATAAQTKTLEQQEERRNKSRKAIPDERHDENHSKRQIVHQRRDETLFSPIDGWTNLELNERSLDRNSTSLKERTNRKESNTYNNTSHVQADESDEIIAVGNKLLPRMIPSQNAEPGEATLSGGEKMLSSAYREVCEAKEFIHKLREQLKQLAASKRSDSERIEDLESQLDVVKKSNTALVVSAKSSEGEVHSLRAKLALRSHSSDLEERLEEEKRQKAASMLLYQQELDGLTSDNSSLRKKVGLLERREKSLQAAISDRERTAEQDARSTKEIRQQLESTKKELDSVLSENADLKMKLDVAETKVERVDKENEEVTKRCDKIDEEIVHLRSLQGHWKEVEAAKKSNEELLEGAQNLVREINCHVASLERKMKVNNENIAELHQVIESLYSKLDEITQHARTELEAATRAIAVGQEADESKDCASDLQGQLDSATKAHGSLFTKIVGELSATLKDRPNQKEKRSRKAEIKVDEDIDELKRIEEALRCLGEKLERAISEYDLPRDQHSSNEELQPNQENDKILIHYLRKELQKTTNKCMFLQQQCIEESNRGHVAKTADGDDTSDRKKPAPSTVEVDSATPKSQSVSAEKDEQYRLVAEIRNQKEVLRKTVEYQKGVVSRMEESKRWLQRTNEDLLMKLRETEQTRILTEGTIDNLKHRLNNSERETEKVRKELKACQELVVDSNQVSSARTSPQTAGPSATVEFESIAQLRKELDRQRDEATVLRTQLHDEADLARLQKLDLEKKFESLNQQVDEYLARECDSADIYQERKEKGKMLQSASKLQWEVSKKDEKIERLQRSKESLRRRLEKSHDEVSILEERVVNLVIEITRLVDQLAATKHPPVIEKRHATKEGKPKSRAQPEHAVSTAEAAEDEPAESEDDGDHEEEVSPGLRKSHGGKRKRSTGETPRPTTRQRRKVVHDKLSQDSSGTPVKRGRGRPRKHPKQPPLAKQTPVKEEEVNTDRRVKRGRGRPRKHKIAPTKSKRAHVEEDDRKPPPIINGVEEPS